LKINYISKQTYYKNNNLKKIKDKKLFNKKKTNKRKLSTQKKKKPTLSGGCFSKLQALPLQKKREEGSTNQQGSEVAKR
jgi:hypothetical protein